MAAKIGRKVTLTVDGAAVAGVREKNTSFNGEPINVSDGASNGWQELLAEAGENSVEVTLSGVTKDDALKVLWFNTEDRTAPIVMGYPDGSQMSATFVLSAYSEGEPYNDASTFEATLQSSGVVAYTPAS